MKKKINANPVLSFRKKHELKNEEFHFSNGIKEKDKISINSQGTMITETREQIDTNEISG